jgi:hypothetical protein
MKKRQEGANEMVIRVQRAAASGFVWINMDGSDQTVGDGPAGAFGL